MLSSCSRAGFVFHVTRQKSTLFHRPDLASFLPALHHPLRTLPPPSHQIPEMTSTPVLTKEEELHWIALKLVPGLGHPAGCFNSWNATARPWPSSALPARSWKATDCPAARPRPSSAAARSKTPSTSSRRCSNAAPTLIPIFDPRYPPRLREIFDPPMLLFVRGRVELLQSHMLGVVGTRRPTYYGTAVTERLSPDLARAGLTIASGMARGIDTAAHKSTLEAGGDTVAVFGCGVDQLYPAENRKLAARDRRKGPAGFRVSDGHARPTRRTFPIRNRIISGMSVGVLIVEGAQYSGSAITAKMAMDQQREVFAVPGSIISKMSWGPNLLIKQGAKLVQEWNDVLVELPGRDPARVDPQGASPPGPSGAGRKSSQNQQLPVRRSARRRGSCCRL